MKTPRGASESSTTSDNTTEFIDIVKKYDVVYNTHNPDYKNVEVKMKVWSQIAEEIGLSVDASKRKWKNLRDSYTKYLRSFRIGTKTSKKYQYWAHAEHMDFLKPYQGPGRNSTSNAKGNDEDDNECDLGYQVVTKATTSSDEDVKVPFTSASSSAHTATSATPTLTKAPTASTLSPSSSTSNAPPTTITTGALVLPVPSLPTVQLPPQLSSKPLLGPLSNLPTSLPAQIFPLPQLSSATKSAIPMPSSSTASSVGCLIIEPQLFTSADTFKKELSAPTLGLFSSITSQATATATTSRVNPPLITKIRRVQPSPQTSAINLSFSASASSSASNQPPAAKVRKVGERSSDVDISAILQANRDLDANTLFFLSLARMVRAMPTKFQSLAKMRCMRIVSDIELELENVTDCQGPSSADDSNKYGNADSPTPPADGSSGTQNDSTTEHFVYVMSPSRVESMIDISSDEEATTNGN